MAKSFFCANSKANADLPDAVGPEITMILSGIDADFLNQLAAEFRMTFLWRCVGEKSLFCKSEELGAENL